ncbi:hypothetical protein ACLIYP_05630 [Streptomyces nanhaiensis]|uniref:hypothetical protein n=1 Tax=Streptomyces nanhaiensis TaxID=679319 RepID=UPI00399D0E85
MFPQWLAGQRITAAGLMADRMRLVEQTADQTVASTTYANSEISFVPVAGATYWYTLLISYSAHEAADFRWRWDAPGATFASFTQARHTDATGTFNAAASVIFRRPSNSTDRIAGGGGTDVPLGSFFSAYDQGTVTADTTAAITMQFSQVTAHAVGTILRGGTTQTRLLYQRIT